MLVLMHMKAVSDFHHHHPVSLPKWRCNLPSVTAKMTHQPCCLWFITSHCQPVTLLLIGRSLKDCNTLLRAVLLWWSERLCCWSGLSHSFLIEDRVFKWIFCLVNVSCGIVFIEGPAHCVEIMGCQGLCS